MPTYFLDCNHLSAAIRKVSTMRDRIQAMRLSGTRFGTCISVLCELEAGIQQTSTPVDNRRRLNHLLKHIRIWPIDLTTAMHYGQLYCDLRQQGRVLSHVDIVVAVLARQIKATILTTDQDFEAIPDINAENWITPGA